MSTTLGDELERLGGALAEARREAAAGRLVDLTGFAEQLRGVCGQIEVADAAEGRHYVDSLRTLRDELSHLAEDIQGILAEMAGAGPPDAAAAPSSGR